jgi:hypothetical protein
VPWNRFYLILKTVPGERDGNGIGYQGGSVLIEIRWSYELIPGYLCNIGLLYPYIARNKAAKDNNISRINTFCLKSPSLLWVKNRFPMKIPTSRGGHNMPVRIPV